MDESYRDPFNLKGKIQKHQAFQAEVVANRRRVDVVVEVRWLLQHHCRRRRRQCCHYNQSLFPLLTGRGRIHFQQALRQSWDQGTDGATGSSLVWPLVGLRGEEEEIGRSLWGQWSVGLVGVVDCFQAIVQIGSEGRVPAFSSNGNSCNVSCSRPCSNLHKAPLGGSTA